ncbi:SH3 domain-containing protein [Cypionkella sinensis]|uniref:SH3 domain-containing protein n=1 Tax=Cypionkella sinensis TaxID=1756043 RepID=A0ABV7J1T1_9RHOB
MNRKQFLAGMAGALLATRVAAQEELPMAPANDGKTPRDPHKGPVTNLPLPRYVSLKGREGNVRRGPGMTHRIDWVFTTAGMPLRITAEYDRWRRVEDYQGMGGWMQFNLLSGSRSVLVTQDMAEFRDGPDAQARVSFQAELGVIAKLLECNADWCRVNADGEKGWILKTALWGVDPGEVID